VTIIAVDRRKIDDQNPRIINVSLNELSNGIADLPHFIHNLPIFQNRIQDAHRVIHDIDDTSISAQDAIQLSLQRNESTGVAIAYDVLGNDATRHLLACLCTNGQVVNIASKRNELIQVDMFNMYRHHHRLTGANSLLLTSSQCGAILRELNPYFQTKVLTPPAIGKVYKPEQIGQAYADVWKGARGKIVVDWS
jgi:NADPH:quinone reductase-like Zn-dependent oxidoreductase